MLNRFRIFFMIFLVGLMGHVDYVLAEKHAGESVNVNSVSPLTSMDYSVLIKGEAFSLGNNWDALKKNKAGEELSENYVGEMEVDGVSYKFFQHDYKGYSIFSSNIFYNKNGRDIDDYVISQISLNDTSDIKTYRGVKIGDSLTSVLKKYGSGKEDNSDGEKWVDYQSGEKILSFQIEGGKVINIMMAISNGDDK